MNFSRLVSLGLAVGGFLGKRFYDSRADRAATVLAERNGDPRYGGTRSYLEKLAINKKTRER